MLMMLASLILYVVSSLLLLNIQISMVFCGLVDPMTINPYTWHMIKDSFIEQGLVCGPMCIYIYIYKCTYIVLY